MSHVILNVSNSLNILQEWMDISYAIVDTIVMWEN